MDGSNAFTAKALGLTPEEADKLRDEGKCFKCKKLGHARSLVWESHKHYPCFLGDGFCRARCRKALLPEVRNASSLVLEFQFDTELIERHIELGVGAFVTLNVGKAATPFVVLKSILCMRLDYLRAMF